MRKIYILLFIAISISSFSQLTTYSYTFQGNSRNFNIYLPTTYTASTDTLPLVLFLHGMGGNMSNFTGLTYKAEAEKYIMVVPEALNFVGFGNTWHSGAGFSGIYPNQDIDDVAFLSSLIDTVSKWYHVDSNRVFSTGFSMGGFMSNRLACELNGKIAAIASVAGTIGTEISGDCNPNGAVPVLHIHSTSDGTVAYSGTTSGMEAEEMIEFWVNNNNCDTIPDTTVLSDIADDTYNVIKYLYKNGNSDSEVEFYHLEGPSHQDSWYTSTSNNDFDAIEVIWEFFNRHGKKEAFVEPEEPTIITNVKEVTFDVYPNPSTDIITLNFSGIIDVSSICITNTLGKTIETRYFDKAIEKAVFNIKNQYQGVYFFQIKDNEGNKSVVRFYKK